MDGTERLCRVLYGGEDPVKWVSKWVGGSEGLMLHDAANEIESLRAKLAQLTQQTEEYIRLSRVAFAALKKED